MKSLNRKSKVEVKIHFGNLRIFINDILHVSVKIREIIGLTSYIISQVWYIEIYTTSSTVEFNYTDIRIWKEVLSQIENIKIL